MNAPNTYRSAFTEWHRRAAVRSMPADDWLLEGAGNWLPDDPQGILAHPALLNAPLDRISAGLLLANLSFTVELETKLISPVTRDIAARGLSADYPEEVVADALRVQCDEAYHALMAQELAGRVAALAGISPHQGSSKFLTKVIGAVRQLQDQGVRSELVTFCAAVVSETVITKTLRDDWLDEGLQRDLRSFLRHHYLDEARHSVFFSQTIALIWPQWPARTRELLARLWPEFIDAFLGVDEETTLGVLTSNGVPEPQARHAIADCNLSSAAGNRRRASMQQALHSLRRAGALDEEAFVPDDFFGFNRSGQSAPVCPTLDRVGQPSV